MARALPFAALLVFSSCALPAVTGTTLLPAGDLRQGQFHASASLETGRVLASPSDVDGTAPRASTRKWEVATWVASDLSLRYAVSERVALEGQLKLTDAVVPLTPIPLGASVGARIRLKSRPALDKGFALELGPRIVAVAARQRLDRTSGTAQEVDQWNYRAYGVELPLVATSRLSRELAITLAPFLRTYTIRAWHDAQLPDGRHTLVELPWTPVLTAGLGLSCALDLGPLEIAPGVAAEVATHAGPDQSTQLLLEPGISLGTRF